LQFTKNDNNNNNINNIAQQAQRYKDQTFVVEKKNDFILKTKIECSFIPVAKKIECVRECGRE
jgi:hypothetical protein